MNRLIRQLPNVLTVARGVAGIIGGYVLVQSSGAQTETQAMALGQIAALIFLIAAFTDFLDGWLARSLNAESALGALLDPLADKALVGGYLLSYCIISEYDAWLTLPVIVIIGRDIAVTYARLAKPSQGTLNVTELAKTKTALQMVIAFIPFILFTIGMTDIAVWYHYWIGGVWFLAILTAWSAWPYLRSAWRDSQA